MTEEQFAALIELIDSRIQASLAIYNRPLPREEMEIRAQAEQEAEEAQRKLVAENCDRPA